MGISARHAARNLRQRSTTAPAGGRPSRTTILSTTTTHRTLFEPSRPFSLPTSQLSVQPWFVEQDPPPDARPQDALQYTPAIPPSLPDPPPNLPPDLAKLFQHLLDSPFFDPATLTFIDAKLEQGDSAWTDWVVLATLKTGRESAIRGAADAVSSLLEKNTPVRIEGVNNSVRSSPEQHTSSWVMVDAGKVVVHILNQQSREAYDIEGVWKKPRLETLEDFNQ